MDFLGGAWPVCDVAADRRRGRELYRYFRPDDWADSLPGKSGGPSSPNVPLTALAQLTALRMNAQRAIISLIDKETMFIVSEATKSMYLDKTEALDPDGNGLWVGCAAIPKAGRLCEWTLALDSVINKFPLFFVGDMSKDERFNQLEFVTGPPHFKVYAGTPLTTKRGINIGSLYILDDEPRKFVSRDQQEFLSTMASTIISHLETQREAAVGRRMNRFNQGLNSFVEGKSTTISRPDYNIESPIHSSVSSSGPEIVDSPSRIATANNTRSSTPNLTSSSLDTSDPQSKSPIEENQDPLAPGHNLTFARAANLMRECLDLDEDGGVVFFKANSGVLRSSTSNRRGSTFAGYANSSDESIIRGNPDEPKQPFTAPLAAVSSLTSSTKASEWNLPKILALSTSDDPMSKNPGHEKLRDISDSFLQDLLVHYPKGKMWVFDEIGFLSSEDDPSTEGSTLRQSKRSQQKQREASTMLQHFPGARQLLFVPLWDAASSQWFSGCICWNTVETLVFTADVELTFISNFGKSVMAECSRLDTILADQQKGDFIGSVSHELRSPLHGILASTEFLSETTIDSYQRSLADTIDACGRTLLDTINHVLDFSKINSFERTWKKDKTPKSRLRGSSQNGGMIPGNMIPKGAPPLLNIYAVVDLVAITEEVIEGVFAGQMYGNYSGHDITDISAGASGRRGPGRDKSLAGEYHVTVDNHLMVEDSHSSPKVETILDVTKGDWIFMTQPGALRRIVMNLFGNAIKYTEHGMIRVALRSEPLREAESDTSELGTMVTITISDTGKGISPEFLQSKLYTPFAQENSLIPGTGLGLSIVRGIVTMLGGTISIRSEVGRGTAVTISLPLMRPTHKKTPSSASTSLSVNTSIQDDSIDRLGQEVEGRTIAIYPIDIKEGLPASAASKEAQKCLSQYITDWFNLPVTQWSPSVKADVVLVDETCLSSVLKIENGSRDPGGPPAVLVLCTNAQVARRNAKCEGIDTNRIIEFLAKPCGPHKLAKALRACLGNLRLTRVGELSEPEMLSSIDSEIILAPAIDDTRSDMDSLDLGGPGVQVKGVATADENSANARKAFRTPLDLEPGSEFPFPDISSTSPYTRNHRLNPSAVDQEMQLRPGSNGPSAIADVNTTVGKALVEPIRRMPRILLVDDNKINLRLLETFMKKRKYELVDSADDGKMAVDAFMNSPDGYDIIFMDISMPIMNGFEATQAIRDLELQRKLENEGNPPKPRAMIIALTGLASGRDQSQAFASGFDLYVTKPASFKEIAKLLDNWETHTAG